MIDQITTQADIDPASLVLISKVVQLELIQSSVLAPTVSDFSALVPDGAKSVKLPKMGSFQVYKKQAGQPVPSQKKTITADEILFNEHAVIQGEIEDIASIQSNVPLVAEYLKRMATAHALGVDVDIFAAIKQESGSAGFSSGSAPTRADFTKAKQYFRETNIPLDQKIFCAISPDLEKKISDLADFVQADRWLEGSSAANLNAVFPGGNPGSGFLGRLLGWNVVVSNVVNDGKMHFYHASHVGMAFQRTMRLQEQYMVKDLALTVSTDQLYGVKTLDSGIRGYKIG